MLYRGCLKSAVSVIFCSGLHNCRVSFPQLYHDNKNTEVDAKHWFSYNVNGQQIRDFMDKKGITAVSKRGEEVLNMQLVLIPLLATSWKKSYSELAALFEKYHDDKVKRYNNDVLV